MLFNLSVSILFTACLLMLVAFGLSWFAGRKDEEWTSLDDLGVHFIVLSTFLGLVGVVTFIAELIL